MTEAATNARILLDEAARAGFHRFGISSVEPWARHDLYLRWVAAGHAGEMEYLSSQAEPRRDPRALLASARSLVTVGLSYAHPRAAAATTTATAAATTATPATGDRGPSGVIARYARGGDYHTVMKLRLNAMARAVALRLGREVAFTSCVDTAPLLEREAAQRGGVGFLAKNTMIIAPGLGSYLMLGELLVDVDAGVDGGDGEREIAPRCGRCRACIDACPTGAFVDEYTLDARRCISYLTIESRGPIPRALRRAVGNRVFGCDVCQEVCPFNGADGEGHGAGDPALAPDARRDAPSLVALLGLGASQFRKFVKQTALRRTHRAQLLRNVAVALGNTGGPDEVPPLARALAEPSPLVRAHVAWALGEIAARHGDSLARAALERHRGGEADPTVREEIDLALASSTLDTRPPPP